MMNTTLLSYTPLTHSHSAYLFSVACIDFTASVIGRHLLSLAINNTHWTIHQRLSLLNTQITASENHSLNSTHQLKAMSMRVSLSTASTYLLTDGSTSATTASFLFSLCIEMQHIFQNRDQESSNPLSLAIKIFPILHLLRASLGIPLSAVSLNIFLTSLVFFSRALNALSDIQIFQIQRRLASAGGFIYTKSMKWMPYFASPKKCQSTLASCCDVTLRNFIQSIDRNSFIVRHDFLSGVSQEHKNFLKIMNDSTLDETSKAQKVAELQEKVPQYLRERRPPKTCLQIN